MIAVGILTALLVVGAMALDHGEIITLVTTDSDGYEHETELWIADVDSRPYLRAGSPDTRWLERIRETPLIEIQRNGSRMRFRAVPGSDDGLRALVNSAMSSKYGTADRLWSICSDRTRSVPIALEPAPPDAGSP